MGALPIGRVAGLHGIRLPDPAHGSVLLSLWFEAVLIAVTSVVLLAVLVIEVRRHRRRGAGRRVLGRWWTTGIRGLAVVLVLALVVVDVADAVNRHYSYVPSFAALLGQVGHDSGRVPTDFAEVGPGAGARREAIARRDDVERRTLLRTQGAASARGTVEEFGVDGAVSGVGSRPTYVYLPPGYFDPGAAGRRYPVLYMFHGSPGTSADWLRGGFIDLAMDYLVAHGYVRPFVIVMPDLNGGYGRDTECQNIVGGPQVETYVTTDVVRWTDAHFRTIRGRLGRAVGGLSTGGYCALNFLFKHQDEFSAAISESGTLYPLESRYSGSLWGGSQRLRLANTPQWYLRFVPILRPTAVYLDAGSRDAESVREDAAGARLLRSRGIPVTIHTLDGLGHTFADWRASLGWSLPWVSDWFAAHEPPDAQPPVRNSTGAGPPAARSA